MSDRDDTRAPPSWPDDDAPPTEEELRDAARLRDALETPAHPEHGDATDLARALRAAWEPATLDAAVHDAVLGEVLATMPTEDELREAARLREALEEPARPDQEGSSAEVVLAGALRAAWSPRELSAAENAAVVAEALRHAPGHGRGAVRELRPRRAVVRIAFGVVAGGLALAASIVVYVSAPSDEVPLAHARSTEPLFTEPFRAGEASARIDRIASARASDFRDNRFARWGVR
jgi:hypothetical protein